jgi:LysR family transcriptional regulator, regulator for bpeEF and oprC
VRFGLLEDSSLIARRLTETQFSIVGSPRYFEKYGRPKQIEDLTEHNCLTFTPRDTRFPRGWRLARTDGEATFTPKGSMSLSDGAALCEAACGGYGLAQLRDYYIDALVRRGELVVVLDKFKPKADPVWLVYPHTRHLTPKVRVFVDYMLAQFRSSPAGVRRSGRRPSRVVRLKVRP